ncbi:MAG: SRPBCC family protein [Flavobacteriales bacterium]
MKLIKKILFGLLILIGILLVVALFVPTETMVRRSITINQEQGAVFHYVSQLKNQTKYGVWWKADPNMKITTKGTDGSVGFVHAWDSKDENVGAGQQKITSIDSSARSSKLGIELKFIRPFESVNPSYIQTDLVAATQTKVTWAITSKMPYPLNLMGAIMNMEEMLGNDLEKGLNNLKVLLEKEDY